ncbi:LSU ribosomal protein L16P [Borrelia nietonii YOR]|uniref:50S ribosomal protein L16 n=1 Tax=Borrelia nietonii YOR TaxID=1293576 RepID=A0ABN4C9G3_9SPIR|nr:LSU ribosomal protein L16P [Borrelia nietonii YOR]
MLSPKKVKYRKKQRGRLSGEAHKGNKISFGEYGLVSLDTYFITARQIEAARVAMTRRVKRGVRFGSEYFQMYLIPRSLLKQEWVRAREELIIGMLLLRLGLLCLRWLECLENLLRQL